MSALIAEQPGIGHNNPPEVTPFEMSKGEIEDLFLEASAWCDGEPIADQAQADAVTKLLDMIRAAAKRADDRRVEENRPFDEGKAAVQAKYAPLIADTKSVKGKTVLAMEACKKVLEPWRLKVEAEKRAIAEAARKEAEEKQRLAMEAFRAAQAEDLASREAAEALLAEAKAAEKVAAKTNKAATTGTGLRTSYRAEVTDRKAFAAWAWVNKRADMDVFLDELAARLVRGNERGIPGVTVHEEKTAV